MEIIGDFLQHILTLVIIAAGLLYAGGAACAYLKPGAGEKLQWNQDSAARGVGSILVWLGVKVFHAVSRILRWALDTLEEASADVGEWFTGGRGANA